MLFIKMAVFGMLQKMKKTKKNEEKKTKIIISSMCDAISGVHVCELAKKFEMFNVRLFER